MQNIVAALEWQGDKIWVLGLCYRLSAGQVWLGDQAIGPVQDRAAAREVVQCDVQSRMMATLTPEARAALLGVAWARHKKRGSYYRVLGSGRLQTGAPLADDAALVIYRAEEGGALWARPVGEFEDGRFELGPDFSAKNRDPE